MKPHHSSNSKKKFNHDRNFRLTPNTLLLGVVTLTAALYALFMVRDRVPYLALTVLVSVTLAHYLVAGWRNPTPLQLPLLGMLVLVTLSLHITTDQALTLPKVTGVLLGVILFYSAVQTVNTHQRLTLTVLVLLLLALGLSGLGLVGTNFATTKVVDIPWVYDGLPNLVQNIPRSLRPGIQSNLMGGALAFLVPFLVSLLWDGGSFSLFSAINLKRKPNILKSASKALVVFVLLSVTFTLLLTQSRGGIMGALVGTLVIAIWKDKRLLWIIPLLLIATLLAFWFMDNTSFTSLTTFMDARDGMTLTIRSEFWERALRLVQDFPFTGMGIGTFAPLVDKFYPFPTNYGLGNTHAHNQVLVMATDLGLPGLVLYAALLGGFVAMVVRTWPYAGRLARAVLVGLTCGMLAHQVFGIMDAFMLGSKLAVIFWIYLGLGAALYIHREHIRGPKQAPTRISLSFFAQLKTWLLVLLQGTAGWVFFSLLAIAFVHVNTVLSLVLAVIGGAALGVLLVFLYEGAFYEQADPAPATPSETMKLKADSS